MLPQQARDVCAAGYSVRRIMWTPESVYTGPLISPIFSANLQKMRRSMTRLIIASRQLGWGQRQGRDAGHFTYAASSKGSAMKGRKRGTGQGSVT
jgi:hypothetical protein